MVRRWSVAEDAPLPANSAGCRRQVLCVRVVLRRMSPDMPVGSPVAVLVAVCRRPL